MARDENDPVAGLLNDHLVHALVQLDRDRTAADTEEPWPAFYARELRQSFSAA